MEGKTEEVEDIGSASSGSFIDNSDDGSSTFELDDKAHPEEPFTEEEIEGLIAELLEVEGKAAEAQEALEEESLNKVEIEVRRELEQTLQGDDLESAVADEMTTLKEEWEAVLDDLETESSYLLEQLDMAGVELPRLYKWIEKEAPNGCLTEAWKKRNHWVGTRATEEFVESVADAEKYLQVCRPVRRRHGKLLEEGASGFLQKRLDESSEPVKEKTEADWDMFNKIFHDGSDADASFGSKNWASVYLASTPQQAAQIGLEFPGVNEVEEIDDIDGTSADPFIAAAIANEKEIELSDGQKRKFKKVKEEDDVIVGRKLQMHLKRRRYRKNKKQRETIESLKQKFSSVDCSNPDMEEETCDDGEKATNNEVGCLNMKNDNIEDLGSNYDLDHVEPMNIGPLPELSKSSLPDVEQRGAKRLNDGEDCSDTKKSRTVINSGDEADVVENNIVRNTNALDDQSEMQGTCTRIVDGLPLQHLDKKFCCTICDKVALEIHEHPLLKVIICRDCNSLIEEKKHMKDLHPDCSECYCAWCGGNNELVSCKSCKMLFCNNCIKKNLGTEFLAEVRATGWLCYCCRPNLLQRLLSQQEKALESVKTSVSSSSSDSDNSQAEINVTISSKRKRKKKIRRILDDAELGEETKRKIAIEKERQERLESLRVQFSASSNIMGSSGYNGNLSEGGSSEVLGDALTGYVVNVVREKGEEAVRIPPSISAKLKAHQIVGIRFMWENIIQSIRKVKSGDKGLGCILAHTMGLGKTFQVIAFLYTAMRSTDLGLRTALIVTPVNVLHNWRQEFIKWGPSEVKPLRVFMLEDVSRDRRAEILAKWRKKGGIFLIGYTAFRNLSFGKHVKGRHKAREICRALQDGPDILVCDEAHIIKNIKADITQALKQVKCHRRIALTGSPLQNNLMEYYCMVDFVREGFLGSSHEFRNRFQNPIENGQHTNSTLDDVKIMNQRSHILYEHLKGFVQRMDMNVAKKDLPPKTVFVISVKLSTLQRKLYKRFLDVHGFTNDRASNEKMRKRCFFVGYHALAQIWNHPGILQLTKEEKDYVRQEDAVENFLVDDSSSDENSDYNVPVGEKVRCANELLQRKDESGFFLKGWWNDLLHEKNYKELDYSGKMVLLLDILTMSSDVGDKVLVFSQSIPTLDLIELYLSRLPRRGKHGKLWKKGKDWYRLDGRTESSERQKLVERFNEPSNNRVKCSLISTRAGSLGINLHAANRVVIVDGSWNPTYDLQAIYRAWRYGQRKPVFAYRLLAHGTMEDKIYKRQVTKEGLAARVVDRQQVYRTISKEEMLHLFEFGDDENPETLAELSQGNGHSVEQTVPHSNGTSHSDKLMESLLSKHHPKWIANYHEHESLLQENEEEKLSKEEQDMAWEVYRKTLEWEEVQRVPLGESLPVQKPQEPNAAPPAPKTRSLSPTRLRNSFVTRKCTKLSHLLTLRSQGTKFGCSTVCGECAQEIRWEDLKNTDGRAAR
ncbi:hypothetical protein QN277_014241 [Acacia crassicarpa]|nr:hypothetical protein QN277_014241 [Acacia crassicarpa]KAK4282925.1 hypothetical protein QN277_014241 [Acacia crassicarpa]KAK4282926.1 hypothetical protein QN277_014241 [Acacia crassicarpa]